MEDSRKGHFAKHGNSVIDIKKAERQIGSF